MSLISAIPLVVLRLFVVAARLGSPQSGESEYAMFPTALPLHLSNLILQRHGRLALTEKISETVLDKGLDPLTSVMDEPILHLFNLTGLSSISVSSIRAKYLITNGVTWSARLSVEGAAMEPLSASGYVGVQPHHIPLSVQVFGAKFSLPEIEVEVSDADLVMWSCKILGAAVSFEELVFESDNPPFAHMLNFVVATHYQRQLLGWAEEYVLRRIQQEIDQMLPFPLLVWSGSDAVARKRAYPLPNTTEMTEGALGESDV